MTGQNIARLATSVGGMSIKDVETSKDAWGQGAKSLNLISSVLEVGSIEILKGFGEESEIGEKAAAVLDAMRTGVVAPRLEDMSKADKALFMVGWQMSRSQELDKDMPTSAPGPKPTYQGGAGETADDITALKIYANQTTAHNREVAAYGDSDEKARLQVEQLNQTYDDAAKVMAEIHGEPVADTPVTPMSTSGGGGGPSSAPPTPTPISVPPPTSTPPTPILTPISPPNPTVVHPIGQPPVFDPPHNDVPVVGPGTGPDTGTDTPWDDSWNDPGTGDLPDVPSHTGDVASPPSTGTGGGGFPTGTALGVAGAGVLGGLGIRGAAGAISSAIRGSTPGVVGASSRTSAGGVLGRGGSAVGGQSVGRGGAAGSGGARSAGGGAGRAGGAARGGARGAGGGAGGRGAGGRGGAGAGAAGRGRGKNDKENGRENEYEVDEDWTDDEGNPSVLS